MSRKANITKAEIVNAAFKITKKDGFDSITSRRLAAAAGCSTQPIFRIYENMAALKQDVFLKASSFYEDYFTGYRKSHNIPFVDLGLAYIEFAQKYPHLFRLLFLTSHETSGKSMYDILNGAGEHISKEVVRAKELGVSNPDMLFMKMWIFIHGSGCMAVTGDYDLDYDDSVVMLESAFNSMK